MSPVLPPVLHGDPSAQCERLLELLPPAVHELGRKTIQLGLRVGEVKLKARADATNVNRATSEQYRELITAYDAKAARLRKYLSSFDRVVLTSKAPDDEPTHAAAPDDDEVVLPMVAAAQDGADGAPGRSMGNASSMLSVVEDAIRLMHQVRDDIGALRRTYSDEERRRLGEVSDIVRQFTVQKEELELALRAATGDLEQELPVKIQMLGEATTAGADETPDAGDASSNNNGANNNDNPRNDSNGDDDNSKEGEASADGEAQKRGEWSIDTLILSKDLGAPGAGPLADGCDVCTRLIQVQRSFGLGTPRHRCVDCWEGENVLCESCYWLSDVCNRLLAAVVPPEQAVPTPSASDPAALGNDNNSSSAETHATSESTSPVHAARVLHTKLGTLNLHLHHTVCGEEFDMSASMMNRCRDIGWEGSRYLSHVMELVCQIYAARPCFGILRGREEGDHPWLLPRHLPIHDGLFDGDFEEEVRATATTTGFPPPRAMKWLTFARVGDTVDEITSMILETLTLAPAAPPRLPVDADAPKLAGVSDTATKLSYGLCVENPLLWYLCEMSIVYQCRCAIGVYPKWPLHDVIAALELGRTPIIVVDEAMWRRWIDAVDRGELASWPPFLRAVIVMDVDTRTAAQDNLVVETECPESLRPRQRRDAIAGDDSGEGETHHVPIVRRCMLYPFAVRRATAERRPDATRIASGSNSEGEEISRPPPPQPTDDTPSSSLETPFDDSALTDHKRPAIVVFTSGSSGGKPKGVIQTARMLLEECRRSFNGRPSVNLSSYSPAWITDKHGVWRSFLSGSRSGFHVNGVYHYGDTLAQRPASAATADIAVRFEPTSIMESIQAVAPTSESFVPVVLSQIKNCYDDHQIAAFKKWSDRLAGGRPQDQRDMIAEAWSAAEASHFFYSHVLGGRIIVSGCGGAAVAPHLKAWLAMVMPCLVSESYGSTECGGMLRNGKPVDNVMLKLIDRPELGYTNDDAPFPRGELAVLMESTRIPGEPWKPKLPVMPPAPSAADAPSPITLEGWLCDTSAREDLVKRYLPDGYMLTGDIAEMRPGEEGKPSYFIIDRVSSLMKLPNGKFFSPERLEHVLYERLRHTIWSVATDADGTAKLLRVQNMYVGVVQADEVAGGAGHGGDASMIVAMCLLAPVDGSEEASGAVPISATLPSLPRLLLQTMRVVSREEEQGSSGGFAADEFPTEATFEVTPSAGVEGWTMENGCLTPSRKFNRRALLRRLKAAMSRTHGTAGDDDDDDVPALGAPPSDTSLTQQTLARKLIEAFLPRTPPTGEMMHRTWVELGCDSLALTRIRNLLPGKVNRWRGEAHQNSDDTAPRMWLRDATTLPLLNIPMLMRCSAWQLAELLLVSDPPGTAAKAAPKPVASGTAATAVTTAAASTAPAVTSESSVPLSGDASTPPEEPQVPASRRNPTSPSDIAYFTDIEAEVTERCHDISSTLFKGVEKRDGALKRCKKLQGRFVRAWKRRQATSATPIPAAATSSGGAAASAPQGDITEAPGDESGAAGFTVFVTGATGYLGVHVLHDLLRDATIGRIVCLVRAATLEVATARLLGRLRVSIPAAAHGGTAYEKTFYAKVRTVLGDLSDDVPLWPLVESALGTFPRGAGPAPMLDGVIHCAATVKSWSMAEGLQALYGPNVHGTMRVAQLTVDAAHAYRPPFEDSPDARTATLIRSSRAIPTVLVSTVSVCKSNQITVLDDNQIGGGASLQNLPGDVRRELDAYSATKLLAENAAREVAWLCDGMLTVLRAPLLTLSTDATVDNVMGAPTDGPQRLNTEAMANRDDWLHRMIDTCVDVRMIPDGSTHEADTVFLPVNLCARRIVWEAKDLLMKHERTCIQEQLLIQRWDDQMVVQSKPAAGIAAAVGYLRGRMGRFALQCGNRLARGFAALSPAFLRRWVGQALLGMGTFLRRWGGKWGAWPGRRLIKLSRPVLAIEAAEEEAAESNSSSSDDEDVATIDVVCPDAIDVPSVTMFSTVYPHTRSNTLHVIDVLRVVQQSVLQRDKKHSDTVAVRTVTPFFRVPFYVWQVAVMHVGRTHPTPYLPLIKPNPGDLDSVLVVLIRDQSLGRKRKRLGLGTAAAAPQKPTEEVETAEKAAVRQQWEGPLLAYLTLRGLR